MWVLWQAQATTAQGPSDVLSEGSKVGSIACLVSAKEGQLMAWKSFGFPSGASDL